MDRILLYHTGFEEIRRPDVYRGRKNADFGQGFYMSPDRSFSERWAKELKGSSTIINAYELLTDGLRIKRLDRDEEWFDCIFNNRNGKSDLLSGYDVIIGPIANLVGPVYTQVVIRTEKAAEQLTWLSSEVLDHEKIMRMQQAILREQEEYQALFAEKMEKITDFQ